MENFQGSPSARKLSVLFYFFIGCTAAQALSLNPPAISHYDRKLLALVPSTPLVLQYHKGPLLTGPGSINVYLLWYGNFSSLQKATVSDFFASVGANVPAQPSASSWWAITQQYKDSAKRKVSPVVKIGGETSDALCSRGKKLMRSDMAILVRGALATKLFPIDAKGIYIVLTAADVFVERFCMDSCGFHDSIPITNSKSASKILLAWVGNSGVQCPGQCAWPFAAPLYGPPTPPLIPPNGDVGVDGMIINIATILAGAATNPFNTGYYQGDALAPLEAVTACAGIFGKGAYSGYPGELLVDKKSKASFNTYGVNNRMFLLPSMWEPSKFACETTLF